LNHVVVQGGDDATVAADIDERCTVEVDGVVRRADAIDRVTPRVLRAVDEPDALECGTIRCDDAGQDSEQLQGTATMNDRFSIWSAVSTPSREASAHRLERLPKGC
jgi:hypothetical protein